MSFSLNKMREKADELAPNVLVCDHRAGTEYILITGFVVKDQSVVVTSFHYGKVDAKGLVYENRCNMLAQVEPMFKPWAKKLLKDFTNLKARNNDKENEDDKQT